MNKLSIIVFSLGLLISLKAQADTFVELVNNSQCVGDDLGIIIADDRLPAAQAQP